MEQTSVIQSADGSQNHLQRQAGSHDGEIKLACWSEQRADESTLQTTLTDWSDESLWRTYTMLTDLEAVFRNLKSELGMRLSLSPK